MAIGRSLSHYAFAPSARLFASSFLSASSSLLNVCRHASLIPTNSPHPSPFSSSCSDPPPRTVSVFWDLDNKPPIAVPPYPAAQRLKQMASRFGRVVDVVAYANRHAFSYLPGWVQEQRRQRKLRDELEVKGLVKVDEPYLCGYCGRKCRNNVALQKHFKQLHERERNKRLNRLNSLKGKRRRLFWEGLEEREKRYREAARSILVPKKGYGLAWELRRAGVFVKTVSDKPQSADVALKNHIMQSIHGGIGCICLVSDDSDFVEVLDLAKEWQLQTVLVGENKKLRKHATISFSWEDVASGLALVESSEAAKMWSLNESPGETLPHSIATSQRNSMSLGDDAQYFRANSWRCNEEDDFDDLDAAALSSDDHLDSDFSDTEYSTPIQEEEISSNIWLHDDLSNSDSDSDGNPQ
ncbi:hypothetical protein O6H91_20G065400 [Diphasiastrum complanatum]|uniref:Uncharacterized protein n=1 Tax=Diphasiastrum complanatum TaxID=34168 RepID=A0ACC2ARB9_DIPCM|nr:hypothetical protein O6H91_20G065400 [Diphasiastrum complanatum]